MNKQSEASDGYRSLSAEHTFYVHFIYVDGESVLPLLARISYRFGNS